MYIAKDASLFMSFVSGLHLFTVEMEPPPFTLLVVVHCLHDRWS